MQETQGSTPPLDNTALYDTLHDLFESLHPERESECAFYQGLVSAAGQKALDIACGTGVISIELAQAGALVTGLDSSEKMLAQACKKLPDAAWHCGDMRAFELNTRFDLVVCACNSLQHMTTPQDAIAALRCIRRHMNPQARLAFDVFNPSQEFLLAPRRNVPMRDFVSPTGDQLRLLESTHFDNHTSLLTIDWQIVNIPTQQIIRQARSTMQQFFPAVLDRIIEDAGFRTLDKFGDFNGTPFQTDALKQVLIVEAAV